MKASTIVAAVVLIAPISSTFAAENGDLVLARSPTGSFVVMGRRDRGNLYLSPSAVSGERRELPPVKVTAHRYGNWASGVVGRATNELESPGEAPLVFISPDERWIFVQIGVESAFGIGVLYQRKAPSNSVVPPEYDVFSQTRLDEAAWDFFATETRTAKREIGREDKFGNRDRSIRFGAWSADSARLLLGLDAGIGARVEPMGPFPKSAQKWLCYFNTQQERFELTALLRSNNEGIVRFRDEARFEAADDRREVLEAETMEHEGPSTPATKRLADAERNLAQVYRELLSALRGRNRPDLIGEERLWLQDRDLAAAIHQNQSWSLFPTASLIEGKAIATEQRIAELRLRLATTNR